MEKHGGLSPGRFEILLHRQSVAVITNGSVGNTITKVRTHQQTKNVGFFGVTNCVLLKQRFGGRELILMVTNIYKGQTRNSPQSFPLRTNIYRPHTVLFWPCSKGDKDQCLPISTWHRMWLSPGNSETSFNACPIFCFVLFFRKAAILNETRKSCVAKGTPPTNRLALCKEWLQPN